MVAVLPASAPLLRKERRFPPVNGRPPPTRAELIYELHRIIANPDADLAAAKRAKHQLLRVVSSPHRSLRIVVPPLTAARERRFKRLTEHPQLVHSLS